MNKSGKVIQVNLNATIKKKDGGSYQGWQLIMDVDGKIETISKHANTLKYNPPLKPALEALAPGDDVTVELVKEGDFWEVKSIGKGINLPTSVAKQSTGEVTRQVKTDKGTWETSEERAARQIMIVRQSSLAQAVAYCGSKVGPDVVLQHAERFADWVLQKGLDTGPEAEVQ